VVVAQRDLDVNVVKKTLPSFPAPKRIRISDGVTCATDPRCTPYQPPIPTRNYHQTKREDRSVATSEFEGAQIHRKWITCQGRALLSSLAEKFRRGGLETRFSEPFLARTGCWLARIVAYKSQLSTFPVCGCFDRSRSRYRARFEDGSLRLWRRSASWSDDARDAGNPMLKNLAGGWSIVFR